MMKTIAAAGLAMAFSAILTLFPLSTQTDETSVNTNDIQPAETVIAEASAPPEAVPTQYAEYEVWDSGGNFEVWDSDGNLVENEGMLVRSDGEYSNGTEMYIVEPAPDALMNSDSGAEQYVPYSEMDADRTVGWYVKRFSYGLDDLTGQIEAYIKDKDGEWGVYVKNLKTGQQLILNDGHYSSASIIKLFIMAGVYNDIAYGSITKNEEVNELLWEMITESDNYAANRLVKIMGGGSYERGFESENNNSKSMGAVLTSHTSLFAGYDDYVFYAPNSVSPYDCGIALEKMYRHELVSYEYSDEMLSLLKYQTRRWKIPYPLPEGTVVANKTGENNTVDSDIAIVYSPACDYILCVLTNHAPSGTEGIRNISAMTYNYFNP